ncbi:MAG TPA: M48 family metallopeptidase [Bryobacteraceae bacterium]|nr:M48 family metallopeptidase [Bryobacteraceae bacterium]
MTKRLLTIVMVLAAAAQGRKPGEEIKPGFNLFSKQQDIQLGLQAAAEVRKQYQPVQNDELQNYIRRVGERLAAQKEPRESGFQFTYTLVSDKSINAFALPGGPTFVHTGLILAADNEAQLAGVLAHEISHVILRHGTNQASKANLMQIPAILAGAVTGSNLLAQLTNLGAAGFLLKFSRNDESQADALGARIMNQAGYNPIEMAHFFEKLQGEGGSRAPQFLSDHPDPGNRVKAVQDEIRALPRHSYGAAAGDFDRAKALVAKLPPPTRAPGAPRIEAPPSGSKPSGRFKQLKGREYAISYPENWEVFGDSNAATVTIAPREGLVQDASGRSQVGYGVIVSYFFPESKTTDLQQATGELIHHLHAANPNLREAGAPRRIKVEGEQALVTRLSSDSPYRGLAETDVLLTVNRPQGLFYMIFIAPERDYRELESVFNDMASSIRFSN